METVDRVAFVIAADCHNIADTYPHMNRVDVMRKQVQSRLETHDAAWQSRLDAREQALLAEIARLKAEVEKRA